MCRCQQPKAVGFGLVQGEIGAGLPGTAAGSQWGTGLEGVQAAAAVLGINLK